MARWNLVAPSSFTCVCVWCYCNGIKIKCLLYLVRFMMLLLLSVYVIRVKPRTGRGCKNYAKKRSLACCQTACAMKRASQKTEGHIYNIYSAYKGHIWHIYRFLPFEKQGENFQVNSMQTKNWPRGVSSTCAARLLGVVTWPKSHNTKLDAGIPLMHLGRMLRFSILNKYSRLNFTFLSSKFCKMMILNNLQLCRMLKHLC